MAMSKVCLALPEPISDERLAQRKNLGLDAKWAYNDFAAMPLR